jgi:ligand-binding SRPBCC domain-containing protein
MPTLVLETFINAPARACFDLVRDVRIHERSTSRTGDRDEDGTVGLGQTVTFESRHFGGRQTLTVEVVEVERPRRFVDEMTAGAFKSFRHAHEFVPEGGGTLMRDTLVWESPYGILGRTADKLLLTRHLRRLVSTRNAKLKLIAETPSIT